MKDIVREFFHFYHDLLTCELEHLDGAACFNEDKWEKPGLGFGRTRVLKNGALFEQAGVSFSDISIDEAPKSLLGQYPELASADLWGAGVSMVVHPKNPFCPTAHLNFRYFEAGSLWWFGGGCDLTPYYAFKEDCVHWHKTLKLAMDAHDELAYPAFKYWCDEYFFNHHRNETRGIGGVFFDHQNGESGSLLKADFARKSAAAVKSDAWLQGSKSFAELFAFQQDVALSFPRAYFPIIHKRRELKWEDGHRDFQLYRRGRYVEFNLLHDRGTHFGLQSKGRVESILMSMPPLAKWEYCHETQPGSRERELTDFYLHRGIDWAGM